MIEQGVNPKLWLSVAAPLFESISTNERVGLKPTMITRPGSLAKPVAIALHHAKGRDGLNVSGLAGNPESTSHCAHGWVGHFSPAYTRAGSCHHEGPFHHGLRHATLTRRSGNGRRSGVRLPVPAQNALSVQRHARCGMEPTVVADAAPSYLRHHHRRNQLVRSRAHLGTPCHRATMCGRRRRGVFCPNARTHGRAV